MGQNQEAHPLLDINMSLCLFFYISFPISFTRRDIPIVDTFSRKIKNSRETKVNPFHSQWGRTKRLTPYLIYYVPLSLFPNLYPDLSHWERYPYCGYILRKIKNLRDTKVNPFHTQWGRTKRHTPYLFSLSLSLSLSFIQIDSVLPSISPLSSK